MTLPRERLFAVLSKVSKGDIPIAIKYLVDKLASMSDTVTSAPPVKKHAWDDYQLSPEILSIIPKERKHHCDDYKESLADILTEKYR